MKYVSPLTEDQMEKLENLIKNHSSFKVRRRAHSILLSARGFTINDIVKIYQVDRDSVSSWFDSWERSAFEGLLDKHRSGKPPNLTEEEKEIALKLIKKHPQAIKTIIEELAQKTDKVVSVWTLKRLAKASGLTWKRIRKSLKSKRDEKKFKQAKQEIQELRQQQQAGKIDLYYFDESGFCLDPTIPYAWQPTGEYIEIPASKSPRLNVLGFLSLNDQFHSFTFQSSIDSHVVVTCFDAFSETITKETFVIIDNAPTHTSQKFNDHIKKWEEKGLFLKYLPPYSPELNLIEILWRFIKYLWLPLSAYQSFKHLVEAVENILKSIGSKYQISFA